ncbi:DUF1059 domain-containing protein [candidate division WWE3 bacterium]|uniref:DUF1059 domain-containing protein n=1 Tax=candidate division WWE3 bacterium TaxID=2053526 RepID=A0A955LGV6_UNCKA|nr:DUF1059 domain-containing protein [candidate division WWE3 bacterium]
MKTMTCKQLGGACDREFQAETFEEMAALSQQHGKEMFEQGDVPHLQAMDEMRRLMEDPEAMNAWMQEKMAAFESIEAN